MGVASLEKDSIGSYAPDFDKPRFCELRPNSVLGSRERAEMLANGSPDFRRPRASGRRFWSV